MEQTAVAVAEKLNRYRYKPMVKFVIPRKGFSSSSVEGAPLHDPVSDEAFIGALKGHLDPEIEIVEVDSDMNSPECARVVVDMLAKTLDAGAHYAKQG